jgi:gamma-glutamyl-gamma-aminobutyrate hydrolase PuuD
MPNQRVNPFEAFMPNEQQLGAIRNLDGLARRVQVRPHNLGNGAWILDGIEPIAHQAEAKAVPKYQIFWGGADVDPSLYDRERSNACGGSNIDKDKREAQEMKDLIAQGVPIIGICRGAQLLNVVNGGILVQHIDGHAIGREHLCTEVETGRVFSVSSTHHQMMVAHEDGKVLFKDYTDTQGVHWDNVNEKYLYKHVTEVVYYPATKSLCIQPHPEWMKQYSPFVQWINDFIKKEWNLDPINFAAEEAALFRR